MFDIQEEIKKLPKLPGVYIIKNSLEEIIYIGKAISLKNRVSQYFRSQRNHPPKVKLMVKNTEKFEYIITDSEIEALILEANLIKKHKPKYNILLRDDKQYPYIIINTGEKYPRVLKSRDKHKQRGKVYGPYTNVTALNTVLEMVNGLYKLRTCNLNLNKGPVLKRPCLNYYIGKCLGPCFKKVDESEYNKMIEEIIFILEGKKEDLLKELEKNMLLASENLEFEKAAEYRDKFQSIKLITEKQKINKENDSDRDIVGLARGMHESCIQVFFIREGKIIGRENYILSNTEELSKSDIIESFIKQFYITASYIPKEIIIEEEIESKELLESWLSDKKEKKVVLTIPKKGDKLDTLNMVKKNAFDELKKRNNIKVNTEEENQIKKLEECLSLDKAPVRIEAYDISNISGINSVGGMVVFENGKPSKKDYRKFKIKLVKGPDDYTSLEEVLTRRFRRGLEELELAKDRKLGLENFSIFPDLIIMDGGKGQVNIGKKVMDIFNLNIPVCGLVKDENHNTRGIIYNNQEIDIKKDKSLLKFLSKIQDEVHRFAIGYHREIMRKTMVQSELDSIKGVGKTRKQSLMKKFGNVKNIKLAKLSEIQDTPGMNKTVAKEIYDYFRKKPNI